MTLISGFWPPMKPSSVLTTDEGFLVKFSRTRLGEFRSAKFIKKEFRNGYFILGDFEFYLIKGHWPNFIAVLLLEVLLFFA